jgi:aldose 1-epimerase
LIDADEPAHALSTASAAPDSRPDQRPDPRPDERPDERSDPWPQPSASAESRHNGAPMQILELRSGRLRAALRPDLGGALAGLWVDGQALLRGAQPRELASIDDSACFPCVPFAQTLGRASLHWMDATYQLEPHGESAHALNGVAWRRCWEVVAVSAKAAEMRYRHSPDAAWPFAFDVHQVVEVKDTSLAIQLVLTNRHDAPQPAGLGWQLAVAPPAGTHVRFSCRERWDIDASTRLPHGKTTASTVAGTIEALDLDHTYEGWTGPLRMRGPEPTRKTYPATAHWAGLRLSSSLDRLAVMTKAGDTLLRAGPVSHAPDAFHMGSPTANGLEVLPPTASIEAWMRLEIGR